MGNGLWAMGYGQGARGYGQGARGYGLWAMLDAQFPASSGTVCGITTVIGDKLGEGDPKFPLLLSYSAELTLSAYQSKISKMSTWYCVRLGLWLFG
ncbi:MAG: hypothetical protein KME30_01745 [Iphinoe sp. HA4291-MV1]|nr:hypothetical protein [Iphinoe sp. HA4291-MV1]